MKSDESLCRGDVVDFPAGVVEASDDKRHFDDAESAFAASQQQRSHRRSSRLTLFVQYHRLICAKGGKGNRGTGYSFYSCVNKIMAYDATSLLLSVVVVIVVFFVVVVNVNVVVVNVVVVG